MTTWVEKSFRLVSKGGYLDKISEIYEHPTTSNRKLSDEDHEKIRKAMNSEDEQMLEIMLEF